MLSLAIGREGQNARLAARLTGWRIDIRSDVAAAEAATGAPHENGAVDAAAAHDLADDAAPAEAPVIEAPVAVAAAAEAEPAPEAVAVEAAPAADGEVAAAPAKPKRTRKVKAAADEEVAS
jgi:hypothetical protein